MTRAGLIWRLPVAFALILVAGIAAWTGASSKSLFGSQLVVYQGNTQCTGTLPPGEYQQLTVPNGATCNINSSNKIDQDVQVQNSATLHDVGSYIGHDLHIQQYAYLYISGSNAYTSGYATVGHDVHADGFNQAEVTNVNIGHDAQFNNLVGSTTNYVRNACIGHDLQFQNGQVTGGSITISNNNSGSGCQGSLGIQHDFQVQNNEEPVVVSNNTVGHDMHIQNNAPGGATVTNNTVGHDSQCQQNQPFAGSGNTSQGQETCNGTQQQGGGNNPPNANCTNTLKAGSYGNVTVPPGATCTIQSGVIVTGNVQVQQGATLTGTGGLIDGNVQAQGHQDNNTNQPVTVSLSNLNVVHDVQFQQGTTLTLSSVNIGGQLQVQQAKQVTIDNVNIFKDVNIQQISGPGADHICGTIVGGNLQVQNGLSGAGTFTIGDTSTVCNSTSQYDGVVIQSLTLNQNANKMDASDLVIGQNLQAQNNTPGGVTLDNNLIGQNLQVMNNGPTTVEGNQVGQSGQCQQNSSYTASGNSYGKQNQGC